MKTGRKYGVFLLLMLALLFVLSGCTNRQGQLDETPEPIVYMTPTPQPVLSENAAGVLTGIETSQLVVSIIFEGYLNLLWNSIQVSFFS